MNLIRGSLWLALVLLCIQIVMLMITFPEFHVLDENDFRACLTKTDKLEQEAKESLQMELIKGRWSGKHGELIVIRSLFVDTLIFACLAGGIILTYRKRDQKGAF